MEIRRVRAAEWQATKDVRLRALADSPTAFATTHAEALEREDAWWQDWARRSAENDDQALYLAWAGDAPVGIAGMSFFQGHWWVFSMWVDPVHRGTGTGRALLEAVLAYARSRGATEVILDVTDGNDAARGLYERYGFADTGEHEPLPSYPELETRKMRLAL